MEIPIGETRRCERKSAQAVEGMGVGCVSVDGEVASEGVEGRAAGIGSGESGMTGRRGLEESRTGAGVAGWELRNMWNNSTEVPITEALYSERSNLRVERQQMEVEC